MNKKAYGFTIVELLIVIVVIAILAAITIVAYNGIQKRALTAQYATAVDSMLKVSHSVIVTNQDSLGTSSVEFCGAKATDLPARDGFAAGQCMYSNDGINVVANDAMFDTLFSSNVARYKSASLAPSTMKDLVDGTTVYHQRGVVVRVDGNFSPTKSVSFQWISPDPTGCGGGFGFIGNTLQRIKRVLDGTATAEEVGLETMTTEELQAVYDMYKDSPDWCFASTHLNVSF